MPKDLHLWRILRSTEARQKRSDRRPAGGRCRAVDMGTPFDFFGEESRRGFVASSRSLPEAEPEIP